MIRPFCYRMSGRTRKVRPAISDGDLFVLFV
jgi:hypothetical protein